MAVTITRSIWVDDDGSGSTGTVINQALHTTLYNEIDTALAKVAQLAGGNTFTGTQRIDAAGDLLASKLTVAADGASAGGLAVQNTSAVAFGMYFFACVNSAGAAQGAIAGASSTSVTFNTTSDQRLKTDRGRAIDLDALRAVVVHDFTWRADGVRDRGVFAQEAHALYPRAVTVGTDARTPDGVHLAQPWMTDYSKFVPDLIVGWQQHDAAIADLLAVIGAERIGAPLIPGRVGLGAIGVVGADDLRDAPREGGILGGERGEQGVEGGTGSHMADYSSRRAG